jgi:hypothetical protein
MSQKSEIKCITPACMDAIAKYGERYHGVYLRDASHYVQYGWMPDALAQCDRCGGHTNGTVWKHVCKNCKKEVELGQLTGLFVPHSCPECHKRLEDEQRARGAICSGCKKPMCWCCC